MEILQRRRSFYRVRTASGIEGWTDQRQLLAASDMANLKDLAAEAAKMPAQGLATPRFGELRIYTLPSLGSPSFLIVKEKEKVSVLRHAEVARVNLPRKPLLPPTPKKAPAKKAHVEGKLILPTPKPPGLPPNWMELSQVGAAQSKPEVKEPEKPVPTDNWALVRTPEGEAGWVRTRLLNMAIPDEVAQYAEGRRIVSYFSLAKMDDGEEKKDVWLWTTSADSSKPWDFDSFRVFVWSVKRHRYETAYIERNIHGFGPVLTQLVDYSAPAKGHQEATVERIPGFSVCVENPEGQRVRRQYALVMNVVRRAGESACAPPPSIDRFLHPSAATVSAQSPPPPPPAQNQPLAQRMKQRIHSFTRRWLRR